MTTLRRSVAHRGQPYGPDALRLPLQRLRLAFMIKDMNAEHPLFKELVETIQRSQKIALELQLLSSECQEEISRSQDLIACALLLLSRNKGGAIATAMGAAGPRGRGVQPHAQEPPAGGGRDA